MDHAPMPMARALLKIDRSFGAYWPGKTLLIPDPATGGAWISDPIGRAWAAYRASQAGQRYTRTTNRNQAR